MAVPSPVIITQILTPQKRPDLLRRPRLVDFLHEHIDRKLLLISASAGYGKTSLLVDYAYDTDLPVCWLSVVEAARDPRVFLDHLIAAIGFHFPQFGHVSRRVLESSEGLSDPILFVGTLVNEIYEVIPDYFVVVVDDFHLVDGSQAVNTVLDTLVQHLPENCHFVISSRTVPTLTPRGLALLTARQQIAGLGTKELRFTASEIQDLLKQNYDQQVSDARAKALAEMSEGWITGILLTTHTMWKGLFEGMIRIEGSDSKVYDYLANEVFNLQEADVQRFLLATSILKEINPLLCDQFLDVTDSRQTLKLLEDKNLFISRLERGEEKWYRYHHLFREFLLTKLREEYPEQVRTLQQQAARLLRESGATEQAIEHYLVVEDHENAVESILEIARETYDAGRLATMARWIDALPSGMVFGCAQLVWYRAKVHLELGELDQAMPLFDRAFAEFARSEDRLGQAQTLVEKSVVLRMQGELRQALDACERAISLLQGMERDDEVQWVIASAHRLLGTAQGQLGNLAQGEAELREALGMYQQLGRTTSIARVHNDLGVILQMAGNLAGAELHFREALEIWDRLGNVGLAALTINNIAIGHHYRGEYSEALELYALGLNQARKAGLERTMAFILAGIGDVYRDQAAHEQALRAYEEGLEAARQSRENYIICYLLDAIGNIHRLMGDPTLAIDFVRQAYDRAVERDTSYEISLYRISLGVIHYQQGNIRLAEEHLTQARDFFQRINAQRELAKASLYLAQTYYVAGRFQEALECVQLVLNCLPELGYDQFLIPVARETRRVIEYAVERGLEDTLIRHLLDQLDALSTAGSQAVLRQEAAFVQPLLRVHAFGEGRVLSGDRLISSADWGMAKSKELLFYLLCHKQRRKDQIGEALWPELSPAKLRSSFHVALYRLRRALDQQNCVMYEDDQYFFNRRINYWFDVEEFEQHIRDGRLAWSTDRARSAYYFHQAVVLYSGEFLEGLTSSHEWCLVKRGELLQAYLLALQRLAEHHATLGEYEPAIRYHERVLEKDSYQESAYREIMRCQALMGERSSALQAYHQLAEFLENELGVAPAPETTTVYEQILQGKIAPH